MCPFLTDACESEWLDATAAAHDPAQRMPDDRVVRSEYPQIMRDRLQGLQCLQDDKNVGSR